MELHVHDPFVRTSVVHVAVVVDVGQAEAIIPEIDALGPPQTVAHLYHLCGPYPGTVPVGTADAPDVDLGAIVGQVRIAVRVKLEGNTVRILRFRLVVGDLDTPIAAVKFRELDVIELASRLVAPIGKRDGGQTRNRIKPQAYALARSPAFLHLLVLPDAAYVPPRVKQTHRGLTVWLALDTIRDRRLTVRPEGEAREPFVDTADGVYDLDVPLTAPAVVFRIAKLSRSDTEDIAHRGPTVRCLRHVRAQTTALVVYQVHRPGLDHFGRADRQCYRRDSRLGARQIPDLVRERHRAGESGFRPVDQLTIVVRKRVGRRDDCHVRHGPGVDQLPVSRQRQDSERQVVVVLPVRVSGHHAQIAVFTRGHHVGLIVSGRRVVRFPDGDSHLRLVVRRVGLVVGPVVETILAEVAAIRRVVDLVAVIDQRVTGRRDNLSVAGVPQLPFRRQARDAIGKFVRVGVHRVQRDPRGLPGDGGRGHVERGWRVVVLQDGYAYGR